MLQVAKGFVNIKRIEQKGKWFHRWTKRFKLNFFMRKNSFYMVKSSSAPASEFSQCPVLNKTPSSSASNKNGVRPSVMSDTNEIQPVCSQRRWKLALPQTSPRLAETCLVYLIDRSILPAMTEDSLEVKGEAIDASPNRTIWGWSTSSICFNISCIFF